MTMTNDRYRAPEVPADPTRHVDLEQKRPTMWLPLVVAIALLIGGAYYFFGRTNTGIYFGSTPTPTAHADTTLTKSVPSPN